MRKTGSLRLSIPAVQPSQPKESEITNYISSPHHLPPLPTLTRAADAQFQHVIQDTPTDHYFSYGDNSSIDPYAATGPVQVLSEGLYISGRTAAESLDTLWALAVGLVINVASEVENLLFDCGDGGLVEGLALMDDDVEGFGGEGVRINQNLAFDDNWKRRRIGAHDNVVGHYCPRITPYLRQSSLPSSAAPPSPQASKPRSIQQKPITMLPGYIKFSWDHATSAIDPDTLTHALRLIDVFLDAGKSVLVSCNQGVSRSASLVIASVMRRRAMRMADAYGFVKMKSMVISPIFYFFGRV
ncbi:hypothetical protein HK100_005062 [Physocladia obscura]|uniref:protein-tyrosine-phosphatase n=1 Tax=Physocladia obscura TaxID=109957 RepID=A0AAD5SSB7_9FUNG|nr:hypothetical protein HK100_005062 [Physocladia obscura]